MRAAFPGALVVAAAALAACQTRPAGPALTVVGEGTRPRWTDALPAASPFFDGARVRLRAARGEVLGVHVVRAGRGQAAVGLDLVAAGVTVTAFAVDHHTVALPSTAMYGGSRGPGRYPDRLRPSSQPVAAARAAFFDVAVAGGAAVGVHGGWLTVGDQRWPVELVVEDVDLPALDAPARAWAYYDAREISRAHQVERGAATFAVERAYAALFRAHGVIASPELTPQSWAERRELVAGLPFVPVLLPVEPGPLAAEVRAWLELTAGSGQVPFAIPIDEPRAIVDQLRVRARAGWVRAAGGGPGRFLYAVTQRPSWLLGPDVDLHISPFAAGVVPGAWTYNGTPPWAGAMVLDAADPGARTWGWIGFRHDVPVWYVWDALYWRDRYNRGRDAAPFTDLVGDPRTFDDGEDHGNLDGVLAYPGDGGPLPSLRLKAVRRGLQDRALLEALAACAGRPAAQAIAREVVPRALAHARRGERPTWSADEAVWEAGRQRALDALVACRAAGGEASSATP